MIRRILCIWLPNWPIQRLQALTPELQSQPLVLQSRDSRRGQIVAAANLLARQQGIRPQIRLSEATVLLPSVEIREYDAHEDLLRLRELAEAAQRFSPLVGLEQLDKKIWAERTLATPQAMLLDVTGIARFFGGEENLLQAISDWLANQHYFGYMAIASQIGSAWAAANYATRQKNVVSLNLSSKNENQPLLPASRGIILEKAEEGALLDQLPIACLRLEQETTEKLQRLGIHHAGQLSQLPRSGLATRLGEAMLDRWDQAYGRKKEALIVLQPSPEWSNEFAFEYPTEQLTTIEEVMRRLITQLTNKLRARGEGALRMICRLDLTEALPLVLQVGLFRPTIDAQHLCNLLLSQLEQVLLRSPLAAPVSRLSLQLTLTTELIWRQAELFDDGEMQRASEMAILIDNLSSRLGRQRVLSSRVIYEAQPELAVSFRPLTGLRSDGQAEKSYRKLSSRLPRNRAEPHRDDPLRRPLVLLSPPSPIQMELPTGTDINKATMNESRPMSSARFLFAGYWRQIAHMHGPERLESGWWRGPSMRRDYYRLVGDDGTWWWVFRDLNNNQWFMHGLFD
ncbi:MAG: DNA polymerase Y family protein [Planctomycetales bacterium]|nr:DNA polymerase Y family protein [Planctomycetales bacterium]